jgi:hypothetical protein
MSAILRTTLIVVLFVPVIILLPFALLGEIAQGGINHLGEWMESLWNGIR